MLSVLNTTPQAPPLILGAILVAIVGCLVWIWRLWWTLWENDCCGKAPRECSCCPHCKRTDCDRKCWMPGHK